jgi:hypothetical protein
VPAAPAGKQIAAVAGSQQVAAPVTAAPEAVPATATTARVASTAAAVGEASAPVPATAPRALSKALRPKPAPQLLESKNGPSGTQVLLIVSLVLGAVYGGLRVFVRRRVAVLPRPDIQVLGSKRLGTRHQLMIVRALGQDHLLSVNGGRTERLMSTHSDPVAPPAEPRPEPRRNSERLGAGLSETLRSMRSRDLFAAAKNSPILTSKEAQANDESPFGAELLDFVRGQTRRGEPRAADALSLTTHSLSESEAVAGLVRLRKRSS